MWDWMDGAAFDAGKCITNLTSGRFIVFKLVRSTQLQVLTWDVIALPARNYCCLFCSSKKTSLSLFETRLIEKHGFIVDFLLRGQLLDP